MDVLSWSRHHRLFPGEGAFDLTRLRHLRAGRRLRRPAVAGGLQRHLPPDRSRGTPPCTPCARCCGCRTRSPPPTPRDWRPGADHADAAPSRPIGLRLRRAQGRGHQRGRGAARPARLHHARPASHQAGVAVVGGRRARRPQRTAGPRSAAARRGGRLAGPRRRRHLRAGGRVDGPASPTAAPTPPSSRSARRWLPTAPSSSGSPNAPAPPRGSANSKAGLDDPNAGASRRDRPRQPDPAVADRRGCRAVPHQRVRADRRRARRGARADGTGPQPGDADRRRRDPAAAQRRAARARRDRGCRSTSRSPAPTSSGWPGRPPTGDWTSCPSPTTTTTTCTAASVSTATSWPSFASSTCSTTALPTAHFVHFYTRTVGSVFFEFVQRFGHYDGYGTDNAPVRLAAQRGYAGRSR